MKPIECTVTSIGNQDVIDLDSSAGTPKWRAEPSASVSTQGCNDSCSLWFDSISIICFRFRFIISIWLCKVLLFFNSYNIIHNDDNTKICIWNAQCKQIVLELSVVAFAAGKTWYFHTADLKDAAGFTIDSSPCLRTSRTWFALFGNSQGVVEGPCFYQATQTGVRLSVLQMSKSSGLWFPNIMHLSMSSPRVGGGGADYPQEIDWASFALGRDLTFGFCPAAGNLT